MEVTPERWQDQMHRQGFAITALQTFIAWAQGCAVSALPVSTGCCCCFSQLRQAGAEPVFNPHHADVLVVGGFLSNKAAFAVRRIYDQMPCPKYVIALGSCAASGGLFANSYAVADVKDILPVDVFIPGCPPDAKAVSEGMKALRRAIRTKAREK
ncbi:MAG: NADH-quinone oxidoreductase subunit NuoB [Alphaproteobacteria bacterium]|nr:NADH-quinone oxidoreductase subunit NuoB [Alphaproteobacteria bacterium]MBO4644447.1 NADH-quinone oxidoreductase subunit NuoB [Alphaproteobacteria bacterium]